MICKCFYLKKHKAEENLSLANCFSILLFVPPNGADVDGLGPETVTGITVANTDMAVRRVGLGCHPRRCLNFTEVVKWSLAGAIDLPQVGEV